jgi:hypothetical protein
VTLLPLSLASFWAWGLPSAPLLRLFTFFYICMGVDIAAIILMKLIFKRPRPPHHVHDARFQGPDKHSFPSGHSTRSWCMLGWCLLSSESLIGTPLTHMQHPKAYLLPPPSQLSRSIASFFKCLQCSIRMFGSWMGICSHVCKSCIGEALSDRYNRRSTHWYCSYIPYQRVDGWYSTWADRQSRALVALAHTFAVRIYPAGRL